MTQSVSPVLRTLCPEDAGYVHQAFASNIDMQRQGDVTTLEDAERYVSRLLSAASAQLPWAICIDDRLLGLVNIGVDEANRNGWFSYWMHADGRGRGWTSRAAATVANWALESGGLERLELGHRTNNPASETVAHAAGFVREGTERGKFLIAGDRIDVATYGRLRSDPIPDTDVLRMFTV